MKIYAMISTRHSLDYTSLALRSFFAHTRLAADDRFVLVDNDGSLPAETLSSYPEAELRRNSSPLGFGANANRMIEEALSCGADLVFMNNDVVFTPGWQGPMDIASPAILSPLSNREIQYATSVAIAKSATVPELFVCQMRMGLEDYAGHEDALEFIAKVHHRTGNGYWSVANLPFFCIKLPNVVLEAVGRFDESFGDGGGEDYDYCIRAALAGFDTQYALGSFLLHFGGKSSYSVPEERERFEAREAHFKKVFAEKWGKPLHDLMLLEQIGTLDHLFGVAADPRIPPRQKIASIASERGQKVKL